MSTNNYSFENILVVIPDFSLKADNGEAVEFDEFAYDMYIADVQTQLEKIGFEPCKKWESGRDGGRIIAEWGLQDGLGGMIKYLQVVIRSGYYFGANIDYTTDGEFCPENEESKKEIRHINALCKKFDAQIKRTERILRKNGTEMLKVGQFSNGEAVYKLK